MPAPSFFQQLGLFVIPNFIEVAHAADLCCQMAIAPSERAIVIGAGGEHRLNEDVRKVGSSILDKGLQSPLERRLREVLPDLEKHFSVTLADFEPPQYLVYSPGDFFKPHTDGGGTEIKSEIRRRRVSLVIFLNRQSPEPAEGTYGGGDLAFYGLLDGAKWEKCAFPLNAEPGLLIAFPSNKWHEVKPVSHGRRFTVVTWFYANEIPTETEGQTIVAAPTADPL